MKKKYKHYFDKHKVIMKSTEKSYHEKFGEVSGKEGTFSERITKAHVFLRKLI